MAEMEGDYYVVYTKTIRCRNGKILYASSYGKTAFRILIHRDKYRAG